LSTRWQFTDCQICNDRLSNEKPSAIFRVKGTFGTTQSSEISTSQELFLVSSQVAGTTAQLGIAIESIDAVMQQVSGMPAPNKPVSDPVTLAERVGKHLMNYLSSFGETGPGGQIYVPLSAVGKWYESFVAKVRGSGIGFLERQD
jgi:protein Hikeshi